ncbi:PIG-L deacetylase family protein [Chitinophaga qingshengii]|uniref:PIG-L family deacetylase n=1 Tax=Chitinophaga qingshengii TaxID=1569794 RepID=A0ABR7TTB8_9BACT|nr:PIG-L family deacetylase [Chitinophaga qingshengii]MBC9932214.1 PIG-L family deacetylase [Chitinophaga qingshengii]
MQSVNQKKVAVIVAHPDDETLWAGGTLLSHPEWDCFVACICRAGDTDRAPRFAAVLQALGARGKMADLDDGPEQLPLPIPVVAEQILQLLPHTQFDLILTHNIAGEYTRHRRHEEVSEAVFQLWEEGRLSTAALWYFAYGDDDRRHYPLADPSADIYQPLPANIFQQKKALITDIYGFSHDSWEAKITPSAEAFRTFSTVAGATQWLNRNRILP